jgi:antitoxin MazE
MVNVDRMPNDTQVAKWGNSLAVRIPRAIVKNVGLAEGDRLSLDLVADGTIVLRFSRRKYSLGELVPRISKGNRHRETNWGLAQGKEVS